METKEFGYGACQERMLELGAGIRDVLAQKGFKSVAADGWQAPTVVVVYMRDKDDADIAAKFKKHGIQIAAGVPLKIDEPWDGGAPTFRIGLFGLDKMQNVPKTVDTFKAALDSIC